MTTKTKTKTMLLKIPTTPEEIEIAMKNDRDALKKMCAAGQGGLDPAYPVEIAYLVMAITLYSVFDFAYAVLQQQLNWSIVLALHVSLYFYTDVVSACLHVVLDNPYFLDPKVYYGAIEKAAKGFQEHHLDTTLICRMSVFNHLAPISAGIAIAFAIGKLMHNSIYLSTIQLSLTFWLCLMQMAHRWSHMTYSERGPLINKLQSWRVILSPADHLRHHRNPYDNQFAIMSGIFNPIMNQLVKIMKPTNPNWVFVFIAVVFVPHTLVRLIGI